MRPEFVADGTALAAGDVWITEWQYSALRPLLLERAEQLVWLDLPRWRVFAQLVARTVRRRLRRTVLWNGNLEPPLWTVFVDPGAPAALGLAVASADRAADRRGAGRGPVPAGRAVAQPARGTRVAGRVNPPGTGRSAPGQPGGPPAPSG